MHRATPLGSLLSGILAGAAGAFTMGLYFKLTKKRAPSLPSDAFTAPEREQRQETPTQTVARRTVELMARRSPLEKKELGGELVHYAFGAAWGGLYGVIAGTFPRARTVVGGAAFGVLVWAASDNVILPAFRLSAWPQGVPPRMHAYLVGAHVVYGVSLAGTYALLEDGVPPLALLVASRWVTRNWPRFVQPTARRLTQNTLELAARARAVKEAVAQA